MKALWIPSALLAAMLLFALWTCSCAEQRIAPIDHRLTMACLAAETAHWQEAGSHLSAAEALWSEHSTFFHIVVNHDALEAVQCGFAGAAAALRLQDQEEASILLRQLSRQLGHIADTQAVSIKNIL